jgi:hypothetical protein
MVELTIANYHKMRAAEREAFEPLFCNLSGGVANVILTRNQEPKFFAGVTNSGRVCWTHDMRLAQPVAEEDILFYEKKANETLLPLWPYAR